MRPMPAQKRFIFNPKGLAAMKPLAPYLFWIGIVLAGAEGVTVMQTAAVGIVGLVLFAVGAAMMERTIP
jgi:hypothetical protein